MKGIKLFLIGWLVLFAPKTAITNQNDDITRAAIRSSVGQNATTNRKKNDADTKKQIKNTRSTPQQQRTQNTEQRTVQQKNVTTRSSKTPSRTAINSVVKRDSQPSKSSRSAVVARVANTNTKTVSRIPTKNTKYARIATQSDIKNNNYRTCRNVFYNCMDEFCAAKDSQLKRCACSAKSNDFNATKEQLNAAQDKITNFGQRLLTVSMDREDALALFKETEGEQAYNNTIDKTDSKKLLDKIAQKLNTTFDTSNFDTNLSSISLSLNTDSAFDSVDSLMGASTTTKSGTALYSAALPVCREMANEVCSPDELSIAESGYQMMIEQDCNTVFKAYQNQTNQVREKIRENSALLDMSRLDVYQKRNSDDILTCKKKMLDKLSDTSVCGTNLEKCLDTTGEYINPATGEAFLTTKLSNLATLLTPPSENERWSTISSNSKFVSFLNNKKKFLEPAMENCQDVSSTVWDSFIDDALSQIKLAQNNKLEQIRKSCTTLTTQCLSDAKQSIQDFDSRALSTFGVIADKTVNAMCNDVKNACNALIVSLDDTSTNTDWNIGMTEIATDTTYETILHTCQQVGRSCIIQACQSVSGNFGLCEDIQLSINRKSILNRTACWDKVLSCVKDAGNDKIHDIFNRLTDADPDTSSFYTTLYGIPQPASINDICTNYCESNNANCKSCRLAERIWGNCEHPSSYEIAGGDSNKILYPQSDSETTLLSWFAENTGTGKTTNLYEESCRDTACSRGFRMATSIANGTSSCTNTTDITDDGYDCSNGGDKFYPISDVSVTNCCKTGHQYSGTVCCINGEPVNNNICPAAQTTGITQMAQESDAVLLCVGDIETTPTTNTPAPGYPNGQTAVCCGRLIWKQNNIYYAIDGSNGATTTDQNYCSNTQSIYVPKTYYVNGNGQKCIATFNSGNFIWKTEEGSDCATPTSWSVSYELKQIN